MRSSVKTAEHKKYKIRISNPFMNCEYIHPLQQKKVAELVKHFKKDENINTVVIFGSSVTDACHVGSDVDIYCDITENKRVVKTYFDFLYDLITNFTVDERLFNEIAQKGVVVYERERGAESQGC